VDEARVEALAAVDPVELRFLGELLGSSFAEETLVKWWVRAAQDCVPFMPKH